MSRQCWAHKSWCIPISFLSVLAAIQCPSQKSLECQIQPQKFRYHDGMIDLVSWQSGIGRGIRWRLMHTTSHETLRQHGQCEVKPEAWTLFSFFSSYWTKHGWWFWQGGGVSDGTPRSDFNAADSVKAESAGFKKKTKVILNDLNGCVKCLVSVM